MNKFKIKDFLKKLDNGKEVFDLISWYEMSPFPIGLFISERGSKGKTYNSKELQSYIFEKESNNKYFEKNPATIWLRNLVRDTKIEKQKYLGELPYWYNDKKLEYKGRPDEVLDLLVDGRPITRFFSLNTAESQKGTRIVPKLIIWDEFNVGINNVVDPINKLDSLIHTTEDIVNNYGKIDDSKLLIFGNNKSLNHILLINLGITHIEEEITEIYDDLGNPLLLIVAPKWSDEDKEKFIEDNKNNWRFQLSNKLGTTNHSYFNESLFDEINFIHEYINIDKELLSDKITKISDIFKYGTTFYHNNRYYNIYDISPLYRSNLKTLYHCIDLNLLEKLMNEIYKKLNIKEEFKKEDLFSKDKKGKYIINTFKPKNIKENISLVSNEIKNAFRKMLSDNLISFENIASRSIFIESIV